MILQEVKVSRVVLVRLNPGDDLLDSIAAAAQKAGIRNGLVLSGIGSLSAYSVHVVRSTALPPGDVFSDGEGPFDILHVTGVILEGRPHVHVTFSNTEKAMGGHLERGCKILTFAVITLADTPEADLSEWDRVGAR